MTGYVVVIEGDETSGYSAYVPDLPGLVAAGDTREKVERLIREATAEHLNLLRDLGQPIPAPSDVADVAVLPSPAA